MKTNAIFRPVMLGLAFIAALTSTASIHAQVPLDPLTQTKYINPLPLPGVLSPDTTTFPGTEYYEVSMTQFEQDLGLRDPISGAPLLTTVWGYNGTYPGPTIEARSTLPTNTIDPGKPVKVLWSNDLVDRNGDPLPHLLPVDPTLHCGPNTSNCFPYNRTVVHLHGGHTEPASDGYPEAWFTPGFAQVGPEFKKQTYHYANDQQGATLWYHDHALGITRLNVQAGLAGFYLLRDDFEDSLNLPGGAYEIPILIQDRSFYTDGSLAYPTAPVIDPATGEPVIDPNTGEPAPSIQPEFFGDTIVVNGMVWPLLEVEPRKYRLRLLNGSDSRFYKLWLSQDPNGNDNGNGPTFFQIGTDGGLLQAPVALKRVLLAPAERADIVIDFSTLAGQTLFLRNNAKAPFPDGASVDPRTVGQILQIRVTKPLAGPDTSVLPATLSPIDPLTTSLPSRVLDLQEGIDEFGRLQLLLDGKKWDDPITELPLLNSTEIWTIINPTPDTHPIHLHLVQFQILDRQKFDARSYVPGDPATLKLKGRPAPPDANEAGWKDTARMNPGEVTRVIANFDILGLYAWHCHILSHEDHEMMRPFRVVAQ